jgi:hypothetical protein
MGRDAKVKTGRKAGSAQGLLSSIVRKRGSAVRPNVALELGCSSDDFVSVEQHRMRPEEEDSALLRLESGLMGTKLDAPLTAKERNMERVASEDTMDTDLFLWSAN